MFSSVYLYSAVQFVGWGASVEQCTERRPSFRSTVERWSRCGRQCLIVSYQTIGFPAIVLHFFHASWRVSACIQWLKICLEGERHSCSHLLRNVKDFCFRAYTNVRWHHTVAYNINRYDNDRVQQMLIIRHAELKLKTSTIQCFWYFYFTVLMFGESSLCTWWPLFDFWQLSKALFKYCVDNFVF